jgi:hypothetical protein
LRKSAFDVDEIFSHAAELKFASEIKSVFAADLQEPSDGLVRYIISKIYEGVKTQSIVE